MQLTEITTLFFDVGGVLLTNGWEQSARQEAAQKFGLNWEGFQERHDLVVHEFETGRLTLDEYLDRSVFYNSQSFSRDEFKSLMFSFSKPNSEAIAIVEAISSSHQYFLATINNESRELNNYRIEQFGLHKYFNAFFSSCYLGFKKPEKEIYQLALSITQRRSEECLFIDDRALNTECAGLLGMNFIQYHNPQQLTQELQEFGIHVLKL